MNMNWGWRITIVYTVFAVATLGMVAFTMTQPVELVRPDYYEYGLKQDDHMRAEVAARSLPVPLAVDYDGHGLVHVIFPPEHRADLRGSIQLYRINSASQDRVVNIAIDSRGEQLIDVRNDARGKWIVKVEWTSHGTTYHVDQPITVD